jgi:hypothetical protein
MRIAHDWLAEVKGARALHLHVKDASGGIVNPSVDDSSAHVEHAGVVVVLDPLGHIRELKRRVSCKARHPGTCRPGRRSWWPRW